KFDGKANGYSINRKDFRVYNSRTKKVEEKLHVNFLENKPNVAGSGPEWLFDIDSLTNLINYQPVSTGNRINGIAGSKIHSDVGHKGKEKVSDQEYILLLVLNTSSDVPSSNEEVDSLPKDDAGKKSIVEPTCIEGDGTFQRTYGEWKFSTQILVNAAGSSFSHLAALDDFSKMPNLEDTGIFDDAYDDGNVGAETNYNNFEIVIPVSPIPSTRIHKDHPKEQIIGEIKLLNVWTLVDLPHGKRAIRTKWVYRNKRDQRGIVVRNKARLVAQGHRQEEGIDYDECILYVTIEDEVYVSHPLGFVEPQFPDKVYKVEKSLYGLHQAPRAWPDIMFAVRACSRFQVQPKVSHKHAMKRIFRYLKGHPTLGLWYPKDSPLELIAYLNNDYTEAEYIAASSCCGQVLWLQNQILDYGYNFMPTKIHVDNESAICVVKNPVYHSNTKHIKIGHHFIRDSYEKRLIEMVKIHTDFNIVDLLTKAFDVIRFQFMLQALACLIHRAWIKGRLGSVTAAWYICFDVTERGFEERKSMDVCI
nr:hypothetical protein [Tanacetum cinerariifolium]